MYRWYKNVAVCYADLEDIGPELSPDFSEIRIARWFTRGWILQELVAPRGVKFYVKGWTFISSKSQSENGDVDLSPVLKDITGIDSHILRNPTSTSVLSLSAAKRMSWASKRQTTRIEDLAYSLMGIFDINMPILYGEGGKAFIRLQEEILKISEDHNIFTFETAFALWTDLYMPDDHPDQYEHGFLSPCLL
jgi:hypothetical protein